MDFGVVLQTDPPAWRVVDLARRAETLGFSYGWTFDSHVLWQEPYVIYSQMLSATNRMIVGPMVTNPGTRKPDGDGFGCSPRSTICSAIGRSAASAGATRRGGCWATPPPASPHWPSR